MSDGTGEPVSLENERRRLQDARDGCLVEGPDIGAEAGEQESEFDLGDDGLGPVPFHADTVWRISIHPQQQS